MGIRIHKDLGYGIDDLGHDNKTGEMADSRFNPVVFRHLHEEAHKMTGHGFIRWLEDQKNSLIEFHLRHHPVAIENPYETDFNILCRGIKLHDDAEQFGRLGDYIIYDSNCCPNVLLFSPPTCPDWHRYDDIIDYSEETYLNGAPVSRYKRLKCSGIYPWNGQMIRFRDPKPGVFADGANLDSFRSINVSVYSQLVGWWDDNQKPVAQGEVLKHFLEDYRPVLPLDIMAVLWFMREAVRDIDSLVNEIRPMLYVRWS